MKSITEPCDFCGGVLEAAYTPPDTALGAQVRVCAGCGLVQSVYAGAAPAEKKRSLSSGAQWGNVRHGKRLRLQQLSAQLDSSIDWANAGAVLDVGSNRGDFVRWVHERNAACAIVGVEPDAGIVAEYRDLAGLDLRVARFERVELPEQHFDFVHCSHTLEHADSAADMIVRMNRALKTGGTLFIEVPNLALIDAADNVEEFFIDKHTFHFARGVLCAYLAACGFELLSGAQENDKFHITIFARKTAHVTAPPRLTADPAEAARARELLAGYARTLDANRAKLTKVAARLNALIERQKVAVWGGGRIFDALVRHGGLRPEKLVGVVDQFLAGLMEQTHGVPIRRPEFLKSAAPQIAVVLARNSAAEIVQQVRRFGVKNVITFRDLMR
jgi:2-polyprenyl-3-methyl-5-hydroxy-6-metoxy-1,4-benzoquinol methylase